MSVENVAIVSIPNEVIRIIPLFNGDKRHLNLYIKKCEYVIERFNSRGNEEQNLYVFHTITSRLTENAAALLSERDDIVNWSALKDLLQQHFGDPRSEACIGIELESMKIKSGESFLEFCNRIQSVRSVLISKVNLITDAEMKRAKITIYNNTALNVFLYNLPENMVRIVRLKSPSTLEVALSIVLEEVNFLEQYSARNRFQSNSQVSKPAIGITVHTPSAPGFRFGNVPQPTGFRPIMPINTPKFNFGIPPNAQMQGQNRPQPQFGYKPQLGSQPQLGYRPPQQFGYRPPQQFGYRPPQQFGYRPPQQFGYRPPQQMGYRPPQQFGYTPPQVQKPQLQVSDVSMRTAPLRPQQGFRLNELTLDSDEGHNNYDDVYYYQDEYSYDDGSYYYSDEPNTDEHSEALEQTDVPQSQDFCETASTDKKS